MNCLYSRKLEECLYSRKLEEPRGHKVIPVMLQTFSLVITNSHLVRPNEVVVCSVMMYANPLLIVQAIYSTFKGQSVCYSTWGISENYFLNGYKLLSSFATLFQGGKDRTPSVFQGRGHPLNFLEGGLPSPPP